jgi:hypothetical protein
MKIDWSQMNGYWVYIEDRLPPSAGEYYVMTTHLKEHAMRYDPNKDMPHWDLKRLDDWVVAWWDDVTDPITGKYKKTSPLTLST